METQTINQAVSRLEAMPKAKRQEIFDFIDFVYSRRKAIETKADSNDKQDFTKFLADGRERNKDVLDDESFIPKTIDMQNRQAQFLAWRAQYEQDLQSLDEQWDDDWANVRDKNDFGREFSWED